MERTLRVLIVGADPDDALLLIDELSRGGRAPDTARVETAEAMRRILAASDFDVVVAWDAVPKLEASAALKILKQSGMDLPFVLVAGGNRGVSDKVNSEFSHCADLARLPMIVEQALRDADLRRRTGG